VQKDWFGELLGCGFPNGVPRDLTLLAFNKELELTPDQEVKIKELQAKCDEYVRREAVNDPGSQPWDPNEEKAFVEDCGKKSHELYLAMGEEKYGDFIQWVGEQNKMNKEVGVLIYDKKEDVSDITKYTEDLFDKFVNFGTYKTYKEMKSERFKSKIDAEKYFARHEKALKLRIQYTLWYFTPAKRETAKAKPQKDTVLGKDIQDQLNKVF
jgi:hypothetical protein